jgi:UDP-N-acetylmuramate dehydrogenase
LSSILAFFVALELLLLYIAYMEILRDFDLTNLNTFHVKVKSKFFCEINTEQGFFDLIKTEEYKNNRKLFIGGASNILFVNDFFDGIVVCNKLKGIEIIKEDENSVLIKANGGEWWHDFVLFAVNKNFWGAENLAFVPGTVGAAPVQNIGAYGVEVKDIIESVEAIDIETGEKKVFSNAECEFAYRDSVFKNKFKEKYFITSVIFKLNKKQKENADYKALRDYLEQNKIEVKSSKDICDAVTEIRKSKLPDPKMIGSAGSFFKNTYVSKEILEKIQKDYSDLTVPHFEEGDKIKIPTGWLIEQCGWKGKRIGDAGVYDKQALVLVNYGSAKGSDIIKLAEEIIDSVYLKFGIKIAPEVNLI